MKPGDEIVCPQCGKNSFLVKKTRMDGWKKAGEYLACSACSFQIELIKDDSDDYNLNGSSDGSLDKLKSFLDTDDDTADFKKIFEKDKGDAKSFCRDCRHFISHPFLNRCGLHKKNVNPMDDCKDFGAVKK